MRYQDRHPSRADAEAAHGLLPPPDFTPTAYSKGNPYPYLFLRPASSWLSFHLHYCYFQLASDPHQNSFLQPFICLCHVASHPSVHLCHQSPQRLPILLDSPLSPTPWVVAPRAAGAWGTRWRAPRQGTRIVPSVWLYSLCRPRRTGSRMLCDIGRRIPVSRAPGQSRSQALSLPSLHVIFPPANGGTARCTRDLSQCCGPCCKIVHARVRWLGRMGVIEGNGRDVRAGLVQRLFLVRQTPSHSFAACLLQHYRPAFLVYVWYYVRYL